MLWSPFHTHLAALLTVSANKTTWLSASDVAGFASICTLALACLFGSRLRYVHGLRFKWGASVAASAPSALVRWPDGVEENLGPKAYEGQLHEFEANRQNRLAHPIFCFCLG